MKSKYLFLLLLPSVLFLVMAVAALMASGAVSLTPMEHDNRRKLDDLVSRLQRGDMHPAQDTLIQLVRDSRDLREEGRQSVANYLRAFGFVSLCGAGLQVYLVLRLRAGIAFTAGTNQPLHSTSP